MRILLTNRVIRLKIGNLNSYNRLTLLKFLANFFLKILHVCFFQEKCHRVCFLSLFSQLLKQPLPTQTRAIFTSSSCENVLESTTYQPFAKLSQFLFRLNHLSFNSNDLLLDCLEQLARLVSVSPRILVSKRIRHVLGRCLFYDILPYFSSQLKTKVCFCLRGSIMIDSTYFQLRPNEQKLCFHCAARSGNVMLPKYFNEIFCFACICGFSLSYDFVSLIRSESH